MGRVTEVAIIGAGPYGLSVAAHLRKLGIGFRLFGRPMHTWLTQMPKGMLLKSEGFASNLSDPDDQLTLDRYCTEQRVPHRSDLYESGWVPFLSKPSLRTDSHSRRGLCQSTRSEPL